VAEFEDADAVNTCRLAEKLEGARERDGERISGQGLDRSNAARQKLLGSRIVLFWHF
jgi:hypothetical protein